MDSILLLGTETDRFWCHLAESSAKVSQACYRLPRLMLSAIWSPFLSPWSTIRDIWNLLLVWGLLQTGISGLYSFHQCWCTPSCSRCNVTQLRQRPFRAIGARPRTSMTIAKSSAKSRSVRCCAGCLRLHLGWICRSLLFSGSRDSRKTLSRTMTKMKGARVSHWSTPVEI